jgi:hypothetical protein
MKKYYLFLLFLLFFASCEKKEEKIPCWDGKTDLGSPSVGEPVSIFWMEPVTGMKDLWYPLKGFTDVKQMKPILVRLNFPENPGQYDFETQRYLVICFLQRDLKAVTAMRIPFLMDNDEFICPRGKDKALYSLLMSSEARENYYGDPKRGEGIVNSEEYKEFWRSQLSKDPNLPNRK